MEIIIAVIGAVAAVIGVILEGVAKS